MKSRMSKTLKFWADVACEQQKSPPPQARADKPSSPSCCMNGKRRATRCDI